MKIIFITPWYGMFAGGLEAEFRCYAETLAKAGFAVEILTTCSQSPYHAWQVDYFPEGQEIQNGVLVRRFKTNKKHWNKYLNAEQQANNNPDIATQYDFFTYGISSDDLVDFIAQYNLQDILVCGPYFQALSYLVLSRYPNRIYLRTALHNEAQVSWKPVADMLQAAKGYLLATEAEKDLAIYYHGKKLGRKIIEAPVIGVPVSIPIRFKINRTCDHALTNNLREKLPAAYCVYVGRKEKGKGVGFLVTWYQHYRTHCQQHQLKPIPLVFVGGGHSHLIPSHPDLIDLGFVSEQDKQAIIAGSICLINLSPNESFSLVLMEAWAENVPVIVYAGCAATQEHCQKSGGGISVNSATEFQHALQNLQFNPSLAKKMGHDGREYLLTHYPMSKVMSHFLSLTQTSLATR